MLPVPGRSTRPPARPLVLAAVVALVVGLLMATTSAAVAAPTASASSEAEVTANCNAAATQARANRAKSRARRYRQRARYARRGSVYTVKARRYARRAARYGREARKCARATRRAATTVSSFEAESMSVPQWGGVIGDSTASASKALAVRSASTTTKTVSATAAGRIIVRARGDQCNGAPAMTVKLDGATVLTTDVAATSWTSYDANVSISRGTHTVSVTFTNDLYAGCDRNLNLDKVSFAEAATSTTTPVSTSPTTTSPTSGTTGTTAPPAPTGSVALGLSASLRYRSGTDLSNTISRLRGAGLGYSREDFAWRNIEPTRGNFNWSATDAMVQASAIQGLKLIAIPNQPPSWATASAATPPVSGQALTDYGNFVRKAIERYGSNGTFWSANPSVPKQPITMWNIWNEPYMEMFWGPGLPNGGDYARMFKATVQAARPADPAAKFMLETETGANGYAWPQPAFLGAMFAAVPDLGSYADIASIHPYTSTTDPDVCTPYSPSQGITSDWKATRFQFCRVKDVRKILDANGASNTRIWITEMGYSTAPSSSEAVTEAKQAEYVRDIFRQLREWRLVDGVVFYHYSTSENNPADKEDYFGFVHRDGSPKPAWNALVDEVRTGI